MLWFVKCEIWAGIRPPGDSLHLVSVAVAWRGKAFKKPWSILGWYIKAY